MNKRQLVILGAGISGLSLAWFLQKNYGDQIDVTLLEKSNRVGGWIQTIQKDGFLFELGPHSCRANNLGHSTLELIEELGLQDQVITAHASAHKRFLYTNQRLQALPSSLLSCIFSPLMRGVPAALFRDWRTPCGTGEDEAIYAFISRRFGHEIAEQFMDPLVSGIYAGDIRKLSIQSCFPQLLQWEQKYGNVLHGMFSKKPHANAGSDFIQAVQKHAIFSFKEGMETLPLALANSLGKSVKKSSAVKSLRLFPKQVLVELENGEILQADHLFSTISANSLSQLISQDHPELATKLNTITSTSVAVVNLGYHQNVLKQQGFGHLVPSKEGEDVLGVIWDSSVFPQQNSNQSQTRLTVMLGGAHKPHLCLESENQIYERAVKAVKKHLNISLSPDVYHVSIARDAIPQYEVGHQARVSGIMQELQRGFPRLTCLGSSYHGVSINDCIAHARQVVENY
jgi:oxygen-dependent protoporphyrinogen oxidase